MLFRSFVRGWRQVCVYAFPRLALAAFAAHPGKSELEALEDIEILLFLGWGWVVRVGAVFWVFIAAAAGQQGV